MLKWIEEHPLVGLLLVVGLILFAPEIVGEKRMDRVIAIETPPCESCTTGGIPAYQRPEIPVTSIPWVEGGKCNEWEGVCLD